MSFSFPVSGPIVSLPESNIDTDVIYPARFLLKTDKLNIGRHAFADRTNRPVFPAAPDSSSILVTGANFGCGSSREHAVWTLKDVGVRAVVAPSFGEIFFVNCVRNGIAPVRLAAEDIDVLHGRAGANATVDLARGQLKVEGLPAMSFSMSKGSREALLNGWDETLRILNLFGASIARYEAAQKSAMPWLWSD